MEFLNEKEDDWGPTIALSYREIDNLFKFSGISKRDIFYDLGSGDGEIVRQAVKKKNVKESNGIEADIKRYLDSIEHTRDEFSKKKLKQIEFWRAFYEDFDFSSATIVYNGHYSFGNKEEIDTYEKNHKIRNKSFKIIKRDLPLIPYKPVKALRDKKESWFFMMKTPLKNHKVKSLKKWAVGVMGNKNATIYDVYNYYYDKLLNRFLDDGMTKREAEKEAKDCLKQIKKEIKTGFKQK